jgi:hypothetical protein
MYQVATAGVNSGERQSPRAWSGRVHGSRRRPRDRSDSIVRRVVLGFERTGGPPRVDLVQMPAFHSRTAASPDSGFGPERPSRASPLNPRGQGGGPAGDLPLALHQATQAIEGRVPLSRKLREEPTRVVEPRGLEFDESFPALAPCVNDLCALEHPEVLADRLTGYPRTFREPTDRLRPAVRELAHDTKSPRVPERGEQRRRTAGIGHGSPDYPCSMWTRTRWTWTLHPPSWLS